MISEALPPAPAVEAGEAHAVHAQIRGPGAAELGHEAADLCALQPGLHHMSGARQRAMIIAMPRMWVVQVVGHPIIDVISMWHRLMPATRAVPVRRLVCAAGMRRRASSGVCAAHSDPVLLHSVVFRMMQVSVVQVVRVPVVQDGRVPALGTMSMRMVLVRGVGHGSLRLLVSSVELVLDRETSLTTGRIRRGAPERSSDTQHSVAALLRALRARLSASPSRFPWRSPFFLHYVTWAVKRVRLFPSAQQ